jgi:hypothetical protein
MDLDIFGSLLTLIRGVLVEKHMIEMVYERIG